MDGIIAMGLLNLGLCIWIISLQNKLTKARLVLMIMHEGIGKAADGEIKFVRKGEQVEAVKVNGGVNG